MLFRSRRHPPGTSFFRLRAQHIGGKAPVLPRILKRFDYITRSPPVQPPPAAASPFPPFPGPGRRFFGKCYFCYRFITAPSPDRTPSGKGLLHIIHRVVHTVMSTVDLGKKFLLPPRRVRRGLPPLPGKNSLLFFLFRLTSGAESCMITEDMISKTILRGVLYDL